MEKIFYLVVVVLLISMAANADDVIPSVAKEQMSAYKNAFGKAIADSERPAHPDNFGAKVSGAAHQMKQDGTKEGFGKWVSSQRSQRPSDAGSNGKGGDARENGMSASEGARNKAGRPDHGHGNGHGH